MKLSKSKKEQLVREVLSRKFNDKEKALKQKISLYLESEIINDLKGVPWKACLSWIQTTNYARIDGRGNNISVDLKDSYPTKSSYSTSWIYKAGYSPKLDKFIEQVKSFYSDKDEAKELLRNVMNSCNTEKQLIDTIPEMQPIMITLFDSKETTSIVALETVEKVRSLLS